MRIPDDKIEEIRTAADIVEIISGFVRLKKAGRNYVGLCPFHQEKTPSFNVNLEKGFFRCFGCGKGGSVFTFLMEMEKLTYVEAVRAVAARYGIPMQMEEQGHTEHEENREKLHHANRVAARYFYDALRAPEGAAAMKYLTGRAWSAETLATFGVGYAPDSWDGLLNHARRKDVSNEALEETGLIVRNDSGRVYDRFRGRVMFPIVSTAKKVLGFGARALGADEQPKYLNSPESPIYQKSRVLYGLPYAIPAIRSLNTVIVVEGYADTISLAQAGVANVVATSGTALTPEQVKVLLRYTTLFYFLYDADSAGFNAMIRGVDIMIEQGSDPKIVRLPAGEDPDSFVRRYGKEGVQREIASAVSFVDFIAARYQQQGRFETPEGSAEAVRHIVTLLAKMHDPIKRGFYISYIAEKYKLHESVLYSELEKMRAPAHRPFAVRRPTPAADADAMHDEPAGEIPKFELVFLERLFQATPAVQSETLRHIRLASFSDPRVLRILRLAFDQFEQEGAVNPQRIADALGEDVALHGVFASLLLPRNEISPTWSSIQTVHEPDQRKAILEVYRKILSAFLDMRMTAVKRTLQELQADPDHALVCLRALNALVALRREMLAAESIETLPEVHPEDESAVDDFAAPGD